MIEKQFVFADDSLQKKLFGLKFSNPLGLGAGFDKNANYLSELALLGFGFVEIGTVTPKPQNGNDKPRLFRLKQDEALINRMGFNNDGVTEVKKRLEQWNNKKSENTLRQNLIVGGNIGKNKITENVDAWKDYVTCFKELFEQVNYFVVNVSSPNTPGLRALQDKEMLRKILIEIQHINAAKKQPKPILLKIAPDLNFSQLDDIISLVDEVNLDGLVVSNTTIDRQNLLTNKTILEKIGNGGLSGRPLNKKNNQVLSYIHSQIPNTPIIASGGIFNGADALEKLEAGASLLQVWTGFVYEGPTLAKNICNHLAANIK